MKRTRRPLLLVAVGLVAAAIATAVLLLGGGSGGGALPGPAAALAQAAQNTAGVASGVATSSIAVDGGPTVTTVVRFDGDDAAVAIREPQADGSVKHREIRAVGGKGYSREGDGEWQELPSDEQGDLLGKVRGDISDADLLGAVQNAPGVVQEGNVWRATLSAEQAAGIENSLLGLSPDAPLADGAQIAVEAGDGGLLRKITVTGGGVTRTVEYSDLGAGQDITAP